VTTRWKIISALMGLFVGQIHYPVFLLCSMNYTIVKKKKYMRIKENHHDQ